MTYIHQRSRVLEHNVGRRDVLRGLALFLGAHTLGAGGALIGCTPTSSDPQLDMWSESGSVLYEAWQPPKEMTRLGDQALKERGKLLDQTISVLTSEIQDLLQASGQGDQGGDEITEVLSRRLHKLHLQFARDRRWVEVNGWRLSAVEAAAYALIALNARA